MARVVMAVFLSLLVVAACKGQAPAAPEPRGPEGAAVASPAGAPPAAAPAAEAPAAGAAPAEGAGSVVQRVASSCAEGREITSGGDQVPEGVLWEAYRLALQPDGDETFRKFHGLFTAGAPERHIRDQIWPRVREHVSKYVQDPAKPAYVLCRTLPAGTDGIRIFVKSFDARKSDPPTLLRKEQGAWRIDVMTP